MCEEENEPVLYNLFQKTETMETCPNYSVKPAVLSHSVGPVGRGKDPQIASGKHGFQVRLAVYFRRE